MSNFVLLSGFLIFSGLYAGTFHYFPKVEGIFFSLMVILATLGMIKALRRFACNFPPLLQKVVCWIHSLSFEAVAVICSFLMRPSGFGRIKPYGPNRGRPILMIHGYLQNGSNWAFMKRVLSRKGFGPFYTLNLTHPFRSIRDYANRVLETAESIEKETGRSDLILMGHSMGGLVSSWYATQLAPKGKVIDVITIGSPIKGTLLAKLAIGHNGKEMRPGSEFVQHLQDGLIQNKEIRFFHIASQTDQIVIPYKSALMGIHPDREYLVDDIGHMTLLFSPRVAKKIEDWLKEPNT